VEVPFRSADGKLRVTWRVQLRDGANYVRQEIDVESICEECILREVVWMGEGIPNARVAGTVDGSPVVAGSFFFAAEDPQALNQADPVCGRLRREWPLRPGAKLTLSFVTGVAPPGQMRRAFLYYLERERAHPYRPFLHYNSWYDIAWARFALNETNCLEAIRGWGENLIRGQRVPMDALVFDDGWDNPRTLWQFHDGFPRGFAPLAAACRKYQTHLGVWLSPFGGYGDPKAQRLAFGRQQGYETNANGFSLAGPKYYAAFKQACVTMIRQYGVNHFKFDGIASGMYANGPGADFFLDTEAMRQLMLELRQESPDLYINLTTGSWPSPFWLRYADSVWRQGEDMGFAGKGVRQQQWLTYRDQEVYRNIVGKSPLFPLNSIMSQGVAYSRQGNAGDRSFDSSGFKDDVRAFFASGTGLQELYVQPEKLTLQDWRILAEAAKWARANADTLVDTHWIGGDPAKLEVYGYASWSSRKGILMLRNPDDQPRPFHLDVGTAFELPGNVPRQYALRSPWLDEAGRPAILASAGKPIVLSLAPFEVRVWDATPVSEADPSVPGEDRPKATADSMRPCLIPKPVGLELQPGHFELTRHSRLIAGPGTETEAMRLATELRIPTGLELSVHTDADTGGAIVLELDPSLEPRLGLEGYRLWITPQRALLQAAGEPGLFYAGITFRQLLPAEAWNTQPLSHAPRHRWRTPCVRIEDYPRFPWRGLLLDVARHYLPPEFIKRFIDLMALHKFNSLQLHLTDDQGWRLEIKQYPRLTDVGSLRQESPLKGARDKGDGTPYGPFFYTQAQVRELVAYARARQVTLVPEIEMPGHFLAALAAYPEYSCRGGPFVVRTRWGVEEDILCAGNDKTLDFVQNILAEVVDLFPGRFVHIGGDEAPRTRWRECPKCQARIRAEGLTNEAQLQTWFNHQVEQYLTRHGRRLIGWDEILEGGLTPGAAVMSWRGTEGGLAAAEAGHDVVMSPTSHCYLDYAQAEKPGEPECIGGLVPLPKVYAFEPVPVPLPASRRKHILGTQGNLWSEYLWTPADIEYFAFPRAAALAEVGWTPSSGRDYAEFLERLTRHLERLDVLRVNYRRLD
jgi:N-acetyl-beta-hexosaminidase